MHSLPQDPGDLAASRPLLPHRLLQPARPLLRLTEDTAALSPCCGFRLTGVLISCSHPGGCVSGAEGRHRLSSRVHWWFAARVVGGRVGRGKEGSVASRRAASRVWRVSAPESRKSSQRSRAPPGTSGSRRPRRAHRSCRREGPTVTMLSRGHLRGHHEPGALWAIVLKGEGLDLRHLFLFYKNADTFEKPPQGGGSHHIHSRSARSKVKCSRWAGWPGRRTR